MKKNILLVTLDITLKGGIERVVCNMANNLIFDYNVTILSFFKTNHIINYSLNDKVKIHYINSEKNYAFKYSSYKILTVFLLIKNSKYFKTNNFDKIICMYPFLNILFIFLNKIDKNLLIASEHSEYYSQSYILRLLRTLTYKYINKVVTLTNDGRKCFLKNNINAIVIPNVVTNFSDSEQWQPKRLNTKKMHCLFAGRFEPVKQIDHVLLTAELLQEDKNILFEFLGDGLLFKDILSKSKNMNLDNTRFYGNVSNIQSFYCNNQILLITSKTEAFPMVAIEAMSYGCVVIAYKNLVGPAELIEDGINGFLVNPNKIEEIAQKIIFLKNNIPVFEAISQNAVNSVKKYKNETIIHEWNKIL